ncbi:hypothetical protein J7E50_16365 [Pedobacter sp. ISL-68]|uniref:hypothetical protein n=1 Tax=unclassified Pedobacter TaxID=2628915 RepID=UPI001BE713BF|nr:MULTISPECIES: hypothetical protein [unclassified Pedobacter]MBT2564224.1 hypothetical protein [Pedobacter sp. ISL-64]MBT2591805.1 hypothetical protein [Pedobacter sp. ISL-68]
MMNQQDIFRKIGSILTELNEQYQFLAQNPQQLNDLELELFLANAHFLSDHVNVVKKLNTIVEDKPAEPGNHALLAEQNTIILPEVEKSYVEDDECFDPQELEEVATAQEEEERVDVKPEQEVLDDEIIEEAKAASLSNKDFFKPDQDDHTFEFVLGTHDENGQFDYEAKSVEEIFDRPLSKEEAEILARKKIIHEKEETLSVQEEPVPTEEDEIGPEPFLIPQEEEEEPLVIAEEEPVAVVKEVEPVAVPSEPIEALKDVKLDDPIISPPVEQERPLFRPEAVPVKPSPQPEATKPAPSLNDLLAKTNGKSDEPVKAPIADLKQAISLNEKLLFIKDLFNGYNLAYSEVIDIINKMSSFEAADSYLQNNYAAKNNWADKQATVDQFYELLNRRFSR